MLKCPVCGSDMRIETVSKASSLEDTAIDISYTVYTCDNCGHMFIDLNSLQEAWKQAFNDLGIPNAQMLKHARETLGITVNELADMFGKSVELICKIESGKRRPSSKMLSLYKKYVFVGSTSFVEAVKKSCEDGDINKDEQDKIINRLH